VRDLVLALLLIGIFVGAFVYTGWAILLPGSKQKTSSNELEFIECKYLRGFKTMSVSFPYDIRGMKGRAECPLVFRGLAHG